MSKKIEHYVVQHTMPGLVLALVLKSMCANAFVVVKTRLYLIHLIQDIHCA